MSGGLIGKSSEGIKIIFKWIVALIILFFLFKLMTTFFPSIEDNKIKSWIRNKWTEIDTYKDDPRNGTGLLTGTKDNIRNNDPVIDKKNNNSATNTIQDYTSNFGFVLAMKLRELFGLSTSTVRKSTPTSVSNNTSINNINTLDDNIVYINENDLNNNIQYNIENSIKPNSYYFEGSNILIENDITTNNLDNNINYINNKTNLDNNINYINNKTNLNNNINYINNKNNILNNTIPGPVIVYSK